MATERRWADRHPVLADVRKALVIAIVLAIAAFLAHKLVPQSVQDTAWAWVGAQQSLSLSHVVWLVMLVAVVAWPVFGLWVLVRRHRDRPMPYEKYRMDEFFGLRWRWRWRVGERAQIIDPQAFCRACDLQLDARTITRGASDTPTGELVYECKSCGKTNITLRAPNPMEVARLAALHAERDARSRGLLEG